MFLWPMRPIPGRWTSNLPGLQISTRCCLGICRVNCWQCGTHCPCCAVVICASCATHCRAPQRRQMAQMVSLSLNDSSEDWNSCCAPGQITCRAGTLATLALCRSQWAYDLQNCPSNYLQVQVSCLGREPRGVPQAAFSSAPPVGTVRTAHPANPGNNHRENRLFWKHSLLFHCPGTAHGIGSGSAKYSDYGKRCDRIAARGALLGKSGSIAAR